MPDITDKITVQLVSVGLAQACPYERVLNLLPAHIFAD